MRMEPCFCPSGICAWKNSFALLGAWLAASVKLQRLLGSYFPWKYQFRNVGICYHLLLCMLQVFQERHWVGINGLDFLSFINLLNCWILLIFEYTAFPVEWSLVCTSKFTYSPCWLALFLLHQWKRICLWGKNIIQCSVLFCRRSMTELKFKVLFNLSTEYKMLIFLMSFSSQLCIL